MADQQTNAGNSTFKTLCIMGFFAILSSTMSKSPVLKPFSSSLGTPRGEGRAKPGAPGSSNFVTPIEAGCAVRVRVRPWARRDRIVVLRGETLKVEVRAAPEGGAANRAVERPLAEALRVPARDVAVVIGASSRSKVMAVDGLATPEAAMRLAAAAAPR